MQPRSPRQRPSARAFAACPTLLALTLLVGAGRAGAHHLDAVTVVEVRLSEWAVKLAPDEVPAGPVSFHVTNAGRVPHAFEIEGHGIERRTPEIQPGATATLDVSVKLAPAPAPARSPGGGAGKRAGRAAAGATYKTYTSYEVYCPVGKGSHQMLGMHAKLAVEAARAAGDADHEADRDATQGMDHAMAADDAPSGPRAMRIHGGGDVIQILPGPYPFADSARAIIAARPPDQQADLTKKAHLGPYSNVVAPIGGTISLYALDRGADGDSVSGTAEFTTQDGARWTLALDRVQTKDIPFNPRFGGVIMGLFYHGASGVHTPLVPTIQSSLALWGYAHLDKNGVRVADDAMVHIMLLSRTRRPGDWALDCWDCSDRPVEELQLQVTPSPGAAPFDAPGGFLFVNWEKSSGEKLAVE